MWRNAQSWTSHLCRRQTEYRLAWAILPVTPTPPGLTLRKSSRYRGIRIEDDAENTSGEPAVMSSTRPKAAGEIEALLTRR